jgi:hypothetical protein
VSILNRKTRGPEAFELDDPIRLNQDLRLSSWTILDTGKPGDLRLSSWTIVVPVKSGSGGLFKNALNILNRKNPGPEALELDDPNTGNPD